MYYEGTRLTYFLSQLYSIYVGIIWDGITQESTKLYRESSINRNEWNAKSVIHPTKNFWKEGKREIVRKEMDG